MPKGFPKNGANKGWIKKGQKLKLGVPTSEITKVMLSKINIGKKLSTLTKQKISQNNARHHLGKKFSKEHCEKMSISMTGRSVTPETRKKISINLSKAKMGVPQFHMRGAKNNKWKGGICNTNSKIRNSLETKIWRRAVFERDGYTCQKYGTLGGILRAHHIHNFADYPELRFAIDNGITLSEKAHREFHKMFGTKDNTREQLIKFLDNENNEKK